MKKKTRIAAIAIASTLACGLFAGCSFTSTDPFKNYAQVVAEVDISKNESFQQDGAFAAYKDVISPTQVYKRDLILAFVTTGASYVNYYGWSYSETFDYLLTSLANNQVYIQYATVYFLDTNAKAKAAGKEPVFTDSEDKPYTVEDYLAAVGDKTGEDRTLASLEYFFTEDEYNKAVYGLRVSLNASLDNLESEYIKEEDEHDHDENVRTTPTGVETENEDYCDINYRVYTGTQNPDTECGSFEKQEGSTSTTRRKAYSKFLDNIRRSGLLSRSENTSDVESLSYFKMELRTALESAIIDKMSDAFEKEVEEIINSGSDPSLEVTVDTVGDLYREMLASQKAAYSKTGYDFNSTLDGMSDSSFVLAAPEAGYGFVINILLPFSAVQTAQLNSFSKDSDDAQGNRFAWRAHILEKVKATDQRGTWFTGHENYGFKGTEIYDTEPEKEIFGYEDGVREYLFFKDCLGATEGAKYDALKNYYGRYAYNGTVVEPKEGEGNSHFKLTPNKINIDQFIDEMEGYLAHAFTASGLSADQASVQKGTKTEGYFTQPNGNYYNEKGDVNYRNLVYYTGKVKFGSDGNAFNPNHLFQADSPENVAFSVINELSFAYNTDTAGLNSYLGYAVTPNKTNFVSEFEYAAQEVCKEGAGNYIVVPSDYGWHVIYCTFSFKGDLKDKAFDWIPEEATEEGTFSYLFFEAMKAQTVSKYSTTRRTGIINDYADKASTMWKDRYKDLRDMDNR